MIENQDVEFKSTWKDEWLEWICGMANAKGGIIYIGKDDNGKTIGVEHAVKLVKDIPGKIRDTMGIIPKVTAIDEGKKTYIVIEIDKYPSPIYYKGKIFVRSGSNNFELTGAEQQKFILKSAGMKWEEIIVPEATYDDLDENAIEFFRKKAKERGRLSENELDVDNLTLLQKLGLYDGQHFNKATLLLFGKEPDKWVLNAYIKVGFFEKNHADLIYQDEVKDPIIMQVEKAIELIYTKYMKALIRYEGITRVEEYLIPKEAFREILLNCINHKQYEEQNTIQVSIYDDQIYVYNDASFPNELVGTDLYDKHTSKPYNPLIAKVFFLAGFIESWGRGFEKIKEECEKTKTPLPEIKVSSGGVMIHCTPSENYLKVLGKLKNGGNDGGNGGNGGNITLSDNERHIIQVLKENNEISQKEISLITKIPLRTVQRTISNLIAIGYIERKGTTRKSKWIINK